MSTVVQDTAGHPTTVSFHLIVFTKSDSINSTPGSDYDNCNVCCIRAQFNTVHLNAESAVRATITEAAQNV